LRRFFCPKVQYPAHPLICENEESDLTIDEMSLSKCTIAIVEDDASYRRALERLLRVSGFEACTFASAEEFLGSAAPESHACLILDIHLPGMSGFGLLDHLAASSKLRPAILITGQDQESLRARASRIPDSVYLRKPLVGTVLLGAVRSLLRRSGSLAEGPGT
jgi:FixJ family two-component response regulator